MWFSVYLCITFFNITTNVEKTHYRITEAVSTCDDELFVDDASHTLTPEISRSVLYPKFVVSISAHFP